MIWIHGVHFLLLPRLLRRRLPDAAIGYYLHTPFPSSEIVRCLNKRKEILYGMLGSNLIGFQTTSYAGHFASCARRLLGLQISQTSVKTDEGHVALDCFPIGINASKIEQYAFRNGIVQQKLELLRQGHVGMRIIVSQDCAENARGVIQKLKRILDCSHLPEMV